MRNFCVDYSGGFRNNWLNFKICISIVDKSGKEQTSLTTREARTSFLQNIYAECQQIYLLNTDFKLSFN